jgi:predicted ferric reductase
MPVNAALGAMPLLAAVGSKAYWYLTRSTGAISLVLLTLVLVLGVLDVSRLATPRWPRFVIDGLHRSVSLLAVAFLALHILTSALDAYAPISLVDAVIPFHSPYRPLWLGLGAVAFDLMIAVLITSVVRARLGYGAWRAVHWLAYASWPIAVLHTLGTGSDVKQVWLLLLTWVCIGAVAAAVVARMAWTPNLSFDRKLAVSATPVLFVLALLVWLPLGPLGSNWAQRSGTPPALIGGARTASTR